MDGTDDRSIIGPNSPVGAFYTDTIWSTGYFIASNWGGPRTYACNRLNFIASNSSSIYNSIDTVKPKYLSNVMLIKY